MLQYKVNVKTSKASRQIVVTGNNGIIFCLNTAVLLKLSVHGGSEIQVATQLDRHTWIYSLVILVCNVNLIY